MASFLSFITDLLSSDPSQVANYIQSFGWKGPLVSALLMVFQSVAAPLPAFLITFANGMIWGFVGGFLLSWSSALLGASLCFYLARFLGRPFVIKLVGGSDVLQSSEKFLEKYGTRSILIARLIPFISFDLVSYAAGLTPVTFRRFFLATAIGQIPATSVYSYLASIGGAATSVKVLLYVFSALAVIALVLSIVKPLVMKKLED